jgi:hypothetical protein
MGLSAHGAVAVCSNAGVIQSSPRPTGINICRHLAILKQHPRRIFWTSFKWAAMRASVRSAGALRPPKWGDGKGYSDSYFKRHSCSGKIKWFIDQVLKSSTNIQEQGGNDV